MFAAAAGRRFDGAALAGARFAAAALEFGIALARAPIDIGNRLIHGDLRA
jgi:hypothetical protein